VINGLDSVRIFDVHEAGGNLALRQVRLTNGLADWDSASKHHHGGAIHNHGTMDLSHVVIDDSAAPPLAQTSPSRWGGGAITNAKTGVATLEEVTIARNRAEAGAGGIENLGQMALTHVTVAGNCASAGAGIWAGQGLVKAGDTLVAANTGGDCIFGAANMASLGHNLQGDGSCGFTKDTDHTGGHAFEADLPGAPLYYALSSYSAAEDTGSAEHCTGTDVRGVSRPQDSDGDTLSECDIGSYEKEAAGAARPATLSVSGATAAEGGAGAKLARASRRGAPGMRFAVSLSKAVKRGVTVRVATADRTADAGTDYRARRTRLRFRPGQTSKPFVVKVDR
jgi:hypothetical protein